MSTRSTTLNGRSAIVTGGATGLGRAFAEALVAEGVNVTLCDIRAEAPAVAAGMKGPGKAVGIVADVAKLEDIQRLVQTAVTTFGGIDTLINNAGRWRRTLVSDSFDKALEDWEFIMNPNLRGLTLLSRACVPHIIASSSKRGGGDIVNISTYYVLPAKSTGTNAPETDLYNASKWALNGFTQAWALTLKPHRIRVNALCPGIIDTPMLQEFAATRPDPAAAWASYETAQPIGRLGTADECAEAALWLVSDEASFVTGVALPVDGGFTAM